MSGRPVQATRAGGRGRHGRLRERRGLILGICCTSLFLTGLDTTIVNVALPSIGRDLHAPVSGLQWTVAAYTVALTSCLLSSGTLADRVGRRKIFQVGLSGLPRRHSERHGPAQEDLAR